MRGRRKEDASALSLLLNQHSRWCVIGCKRGRMHPRSQPTQRPPQCTQVLRPGGVMTILAYRGHSGGAQEYEAVQQLVAALTPLYWTSTEVKLLNRPTAPSLVLVWRQPLYYKPS